MSAPVITVAGTWGELPGHGKWWDRDSDFWAMLVEGGLTSVDAIDPFMWSTDLDGLDNTNAGWAAAGRALFWYAAAKAPGIPVSVIAHSHGGQVLAYAAEAGLRLEHAITVATPVRSDLGRQYAVLAKVAKTWTHIYTDEKYGGAWQALGEWALGGTPWRVRREMPGARNIFLPGRSHGDLVANANLWRSPPRGQGWRGLLLP